VTQGSTVHLQDVMVCRLLQGDGVMTLGITYFTGRLWWQGQTVKSDGVLMMGNGL